MSSFDFEVSREQEFGFNFLDLSFEIKDNKSVEVNGSTKDEDDIDIRGKDEKSTKIALFSPFGLLAAATTVTNQMLATSAATSSGILREQASFGPLNNIFGISQSHEKTVCVDINKRNK